MAKYGKVDMARLEELYTVNHLTVREIGSVMGCTHAAVWKALQRRGISAAVGEWVDLTCFICGQAFKKTRSEWRYNHKHFCTQQCYAKHLENPDYNPSRQGQRRARACVSQHFELQPGHVVHHHDSDVTHNEISNLAVFATQSEHTSFERGGFARPIWDGKLFAETGDGDTSHSRPVRYRIPKSKGVRS